MTNCFTTSHCGSLCTTQYFSLADRWLSSLQADTSVHNGGQPHTFSAVHWQSFVDRQERRHWCISTQRARIWVLKTTSTVSKASGSCVEGPIQTRCRAPDTQRASVICIDCSIAVAATSKALLFSRYRVWQFGPVTPECPSLKVIGQRVADSAEFVLFSNTEMFANRT